MHLSGRGGRGISIKRDVYYLDKALHGLGIPLKLATFALSGTTSVLDSEKSTQTTSFELNFTILLHCNYFTKALYKQKQYV